MSLIYFLMAVSDEANPKKAKLEQIVVENFVPLTLGNSCILAETFDFVCAFPDTDIQSPLSSNGLISMTWKDA